MDKKEIVTNDDNRDDPVDQQIRCCIDNYESFFVFAGAGSGKTRSLVNALKHIVKTRGNKLQAKNKKVAVITFTNAAKNEILHRLDYNPLFAVSTIHSFLWGLIKFFQKDISLWKRDELKDKLDELKDKKVRAKTRDYTSDIAEIEEKIGKLSTIKKFTYNPSGDNFEVNALNHADVIKIGVEFIAHYPTMQKILKSKFPILLIDESQDTNKGIVDTFLKVQQGNDDMDFLIGMFGDEIQRIYMEGKVNLSSHIPKDWKKPEKIMNHRSKERIIKLANNIRESLDSQKQQARSDKDGGVVRLFIAKAADEVDKEAIEEAVFEKMTEISQDAKWLKYRERKVLVLEHSMAAKRLGFESLLESYNKLFSSATPPPELTFLMNIIHPIVEAHKIGDEFAIMKILRQHAIPLRKSELKKAADQTNVLADVKNKLSCFLKLWDNNLDPTVHKVYKKLEILELFELPSMEKEDKVHTFLNVSFTQVKAYWDYINESTPFDTHQGVKGLEFSRVAVIMDDGDAGGKNFSYEKLFGVKPLSPRDKNNIKQGKDSVMDRTSRLLYVTCTRAKESLALIAYTNDTKKLRETALKNNWFTECEIEILQPPSK